MEQDVVAGLTFGAVVSHDGGATWHWFCEAAIGYNGLYDPDYTWTRTGAIFATTFEGLKKNSDGCTFAATPPGTTFVTQVETGPDGAIYYAAGDMADGKIYKSTDNGVTFPTSANPGQANDWWESIVVAPSDAQRVYLTGYRLVSGNPKQFLLFRSDNGGQSFVPMSMNGFTTSMNSAIGIVGVSATNPDIVYAKVSLENGTNSEGIYRSINAGASWTKLLSKNETISFVVRKNGEIVYGTQLSGAGKSTHTSTTWTDLVNPPHINCLVENGNGEVWACTSNFGSMSLPKDGYGIMKTTNLSAWTGVLKFEDIRAPVDCAIGTVQRDQCVEKYMSNQSVWCCMAQMLGLTSPDLDCKTGPLMCTITPLVDAPPGGGGDITVKPPKGCCDAGGGPGALLVGLLVGIVLLRRRRC